MRQELPRELIKLADHQAGILATRQLIDGGLSRAVIRRMTRRWTRLMNGLYCTTQPTWLSGVWAGLVAGGKESAAGGAAALYLEGILRDPPPLITVWSPEARMNLQLGPFTIMLRRGDRKAKGTVRRTRVEAGLLDMAEHSDEDSITDAVVRAFTEQKTTAERLLKELEARGRNAHRTHLIDLCRHAANGIESALEWHFARKVIDAHSIPAPTLQPRSQFGRSDGRWDEYGVRLELDGLRDHQDASRDWFRDNDHLIHSGDATLRYGWNAATKQACRAGAQVSAVLRGAGWTGEPAKCGRDCAVGTALRSAPAVGLSPEFIQI